MQAPPNSSLTRSSGLDAEEDLNQPLLEKIRAAQQLSEPESFPQQPQQWFLPIDKLHEIVQPDRVKQYLQDEKILEHQIIQEVVDYICGDSKNKADAKEARKLFCILLLIEKPGSILDFYQEAVYDHDLPFLRKQTHQDLFRLVRSDEQALHCLDSSSWETVYLERFDEYQWRLLAPILSEDSESHNTLHNRAILPWNHCGSTRSGPESVPRVCRIQVHPSHHKFASVSMSRRATLATPAYQ